MKDPEVKNLVEENRMLRRKLETLQVLVWEERVKRQEVEARLLLLEGHDYDTRSVFFTGGNHKSSEAQNRKMLWIS